MNDKKIKIANKNHKKKKYIRHINIIHITQILQRQQKIMQNETKKPGYPWYIRNYNSITSAVWITSVFTCMYASTLSNKAVVAVFTLPCIFAGYFSTFEMFKSQHDIEKEYDKGR